MNSDLIAYIDGQPILFNILKSWGFLPTDVAGSPKLEAMMLSYIKTYQETIAKIHKLSV